MQKIVLVPNLHLPNKQFIEWGQNLSKFGPEVVLFSLKSDQVIDLTWKGILEQIKRFHGEYNEKGRELYYLTEGYGIMPVLESVESNKISGIFSLQPIISKSKDSKSKDLYGEAKRIEHLLDESSAAVHLFLAEQNFENDHKRSIKILKRLAKPNISVKSFETSSLLSEQLLQEIEDYLLYNLRIK